MRDRSLTLRARQLGEPARTLREWIFSTLVMVRKFPSIEMWGLLAHLVGMDETGAGTVEAVDCEGSALPSGFDVAGWARQACEMSGVPFAVEDPVILQRLLTLVAHPG